MNMTEIKNKITEEKYIATLTNDGKFKLYSIADDSGNSDIIIDTDEYINNYELI